MGAPSARAASRADDGRSPSFARLGGRAEHARAGRLGIARVARCGVEPLHLTHLGRSSGRRASSSRTRADMGFTCAGRTGRPRSLADVGLAAARAGRVASSAAGIHCAVLGRAGCAGSRMESARGAASPCAAHGRTGSRAGQAWVSNRAIVESAGSPGVGRRSAGSGRASRTGLTACVDRLGWTGCFGAARLTTDRRACVGQPGRGFVGHPQNGRTCRSGRAVMGRTSGPAPSVGPARRCFGTGRARRRDAHAAGRCPAPAVECGSRAGVVSPCLDSG